MTIVITLPYFFDGEAEQIVQLLHSSVDLIHIRKPESKAEEVERLIMSILPSPRAPRPSRIGDEIPPTWRSSQWSQPSTTYGLGRKREQELPFIGGSEGMEGEV